MNLLVFYLKTKTKKNAFLFMKNSIDEAQEMQQPQTTALQQHRGEKQPKL